MNRDGFTLIEHQPILVCFNGAVLGAPLVMGQLCVERQRELMVMKTEKRSLRSILLALGGFSLMAASVAIALALRGHGGAALLFLLLGSVVVAASRTC